VSLPDHFALFGLPERFEVDRADLEQRFLQKSRELHPDRHATGTSEQRLDAVRRTTDLNEAYQILKDDFRRTVYLLRRRGLETSENESQDQRMTVDSDLLMQVLELREALAEAQSTKDQARVQSLSDDVRGRVDKAWSDIRTSWSAVEGGNQKALQDIANHVTSLRYYRRFLDEVASFDES
jgi:molecular chaperone HscB